MSLDWGTTFRGVRVPSKMVSSCRFLCNLVEIMHGGHGLSAYPKAVLVKKKKESTVPSTVTDLTSLVSGDSKVVKIRGAQQGTIQQFAKSNRYRRITETDTLKDVNEKLLEMEE